MKPTLILAFVATHIAMYMADEPDYTSCIDVLQTNSDTINDLESYLTDEKFRKACRLARNLQISPETFIVRNCVESLRSSSAYALEAAKTAKEMVATNSDYQGACEVLQA